MNDFKIVLKPITSVITAILMLSLPSCGKDGRINRNDPSVDPLGKYAELTYTANADTVFFSWSMLKQVDFDGFEVYDKSNGRQTFSAGESSCILTGIPLQEDYDITLSLLRNNALVWSTRLTVNIDGLDRKIARKIIQDDAGVTEGDGMYSILLPDGRSIFLMGDSYTGKVVDGVRVSGNHMFRNSYNVYDKGTVTAITGGDSHSAAVPVGWPDESRWYWPGHGFVQDDVLYIFQFLMYQGEEGSWGFRYESTHLLKYCLPDIALIEDKQIPYSGEASMMFGAAALNDGGSLYVYSQIDRESSDVFNPVSEAYCARTTAYDIDTRWEYFTGSGWSEDPSDARRMEGLSDVPVSSQYNVFKLGDKYVLLTQHKFLNNGSVYTFTSDTPYGPWGNRKLIYKITLDNPDWYCYNAMAHPQFEQDGRILISYNVNTNTFSEQATNVESYRPRFFWYPIKSITGD